MIIPALWKQALDGLPNSQKIFTSRQIFEQQKLNGVTKKLVGLEMTDKGIPRHGYPYRMRQVMK